MSFQDEQTQVSTDVSDWEEDQEEEEEYVFESFSLSSESMDDVENIEGSYIHNDKFIISTYDSFDGQSSAFDEDKHDIFDGNSNNDRRTIATGVYTPSRAILHPSEEDDDDSYYSDAFERDDNSNSSTDSEYTFSTFTSSPCKEGYHFKKSPARTATQPLTSLNPEENVFIQINSSTSPQPINVSSHERQQQQPPPPDGNIVLRSKNCNSSVFENDASTKFTKNEIANKVCRSPIRSMNPPPSCFAEKQKLDMTNYNTEISSPTTTDESSFAPPLPPTKQKEIEEHEWMNIRNKIIQIVNASMMVFKEQY